MGDSQTAYILALTSDLIPDSLADAAGKHFADAIVRRDTHLSAGFLGVDGLLPVLTRIGRADPAYTLLQNTTYPSRGLNDSATGYAPLSRRRLVPSGPTI